MSKHWEPCPRCSSSRVRTMGKTFWFLVPFASGGCLIWIGIFFFPILILAILLIVASPIGLFMPKMNQCQDCKHSWKASAQAKTSI